MVARADYDCTAPFGPFDRFCRKFSSRTLHLHVILMIRLGLKTEPFLREMVYLAVLTFLAATTFSTALMEISFVVALAGWLLLKIRHPDPFPFESRMFVFLLGFVFLSVISIFWSEFPKQSIRGVFKVLKQFLTFWIVAETLQTRRRQESAFRVLVGIFIFLALDGMWQYLFGKDLLRQIPIEVASSGSRVSASFHNYGLLAAFVVSFWPLLVSQLEEKAKKSTLFLTALAIVLGGLLLFWTRSRGGWVAFLGGLTFFLWLQGKRFLLGGLVLVALISLFFLPRQMVIHLDSQKKEQSLVERLYLWDRAFQVIEARPWTGTGINTYKVAHEKYDRRGNWRVRGYYAHNGYLQIAAETGLPSLACFLAFLFFYFKNTLRFLTSVLEEGQRRSLIGILAGMAGFLVLGIIDTIFHNPQSVMGFWFLAGWGMAVISPKTGQLTQ